MGLDWITPCHSELDTVHLNNAMVHSRSHSPFHADRASIFSILVLNSRGKYRRICMDHTNHENARLKAFIGGLMQSLCTVTLKLPATVLSHDQQMNRMKLPCHSKRQSQKTIETATSVARPTCHLFGRTRDVVGSLSRTVTRSLRTFVPRSLVHIRVWRKRKRVHLSTVRVRREGDQIRPCPHSLTRGRGNRPKPDFRPTVWEGEK